MTVVACAVCGTPTYKKPSHVLERNYCSWDCQHVGTARPRVDIAERFWRMVDKTGEHWLWTGSLTSQGYGQLQTGSSRDGSRRPQIATRIAWLLATGEPIPDGLEALHTCDTPACVRNDVVGTYEVNGISYPRRGHLFIATQAVNLQDMHQKGRYVNGMRLRVERRLAEANR